MANSIEKGCSCGGACNHVLGQVKSDEEIEFSEVCLQYCPTDYYTLKKRRE